MIKTNWLSTVLAALISFCLPIEAEAKTNDADPTVLQCHNLTLRYAWQPEQVVAQVASLWLVGHSQPAACNQLFRWWKQRGYLTENLIWQRFQLALAENNLAFARYLAKALPSNRRSLVKLWLNAHIF